MLYPIPILMWGRRYFIFLKETNIEGSFYMTSGTNIGIVENLILL